MASRDNTQVIQANIPKDKAIALRQKLIAEGKTIQGFIVEQVNKYLGRQTN